VSTSALQRSYAQGGDILQIHNAERDAIGVPPLSWSTSLARTNNSSISHLADFASIYNWLWRISVEPDKYPIVITADTDDDVRIFLEKILTVDSIISHIILNGYRRIMYKKVSLTIIMASAIAAILIVPWAALQRSHAQSDITDTEPVLKAHNDARDAVGSPALKWSDSLAADAQSWANELVKLNQGKFINEAQSQHAPGNKAENIASGYGASSSGEVSPPSTASLVQGWVNEKQYWKGGTFGSPDSCQAPGKEPGKGCGHYTQVVWRTTTEVGCGIATDSGKTSDGLPGKWYALVCRYSPEGNWEGEKPY